MNTESWIKRVTNLTESLKKSKNASKINEYKKLSNNYENVRATTFANNAMKEKVDTVYRNLHNTYTSSQGGTRHKRIHKRRFTKKRR